MLMNPLSAKVADQLLKRRPKRRSEAVRGAVMGLMPQSAELAGLTCSGRRLDLRPAGLAMDGFRLHLARPQWLDDASSCASEPDRPHGSLSQQHRRRSRGCGSGCQAAAASIDRSSADRLIATARSLTSQPASRASCAAPAQEEPGGLASQGMVRRSAAAAASSAGGDDDGSSRRVRAGSGPCLGNIDLQRDGVGGCDNRNGVPSRQSCPKRLDKPGLTTKARASRSGKMEVKGESQGDGTVAEGGARACPPRRRSCNVRCPSCSRLKRLRRQQGRRPPFRMSLYRVRRTVTRKRSLKWCVLPSERALCSLPLRACRRWTGPLFASLLLNLCTGDRCSSLAKYRILSARRSATSRTSSEVRSLNS